MIPPPASKARGGIGVAVMQALRGRLLVFAVFLLAVLAPSVALAFLALRAAERESLYVERSLESSLLAEADQMADRIAGLTDELLKSLARDCSRGNPLVGARFVLRDGKMSVDSEGDERNSFLFAFGSFLTEGARIPVYDSIAQVYRKSMAAPELAAGAGRNYSPRQDASYSVSSVASTLDMPADENEAGLLAAGIAPEPAERDEAFKHASRAGFEITERNVEPQSKKAYTPKTPPDQRSETVSRTRTFEELLRERDSGLLPRLVDGVLSLLYWTKRPGGEIAGCEVNMDELRRRVAGVLPAERSEVRLIMALDEDGKPVAPLGSSQAFVPDLRRPFVAREISPVLPRWEVGAWLVDPALPTRVARATKLAVWSLVAVLICAIAAGGAVVLWILSREMRAAAQKTTFVANVSHELRTPLTSIRLFAELLLSGRQPDEERRREYLRTMVLETERLSRLVDDALAFSRRGTSKMSFEMRPVSLSDIAWSAVELLREGMGNNGFEIRLSMPESDGQEDALTVSGDAEALRQVIVNLLSNAEKYSGEAREIEVRCRRKEGFPVVEVADRGIGIDPKFAGKIFHAFFRCDDSLASPKNGVGLGLSIARDIARKHGGDVTYAPREGGGSVFTVSLPGL